MRNEHGNTVTGTRLYISTQVKPGTYPALRHNLANNTTAKGTLVVRHKGIAEFYKDET